jgi:GntR family transcriptional regulator
MKKPRSFAFRLDPHSGVPVYRQIIEQVTLAVAGGGLQPGEQLPTVRQVAAELSINPNTVMRAYREMEIRGLLATRQGMGTFVARVAAEPAANERLREERLTRMAADCATRAGAEGYSIKELRAALKELARGQDRR